MGKGTHRKLAAILAADVVGYSRLMGEDEAETLSSLRNLRSGLFDPTVTDHRGDIVKSMGDGWLVAFESAKDAVACAIQIQEELTGGDGLQLRIGVHVGDVTRADDDIYGDGINIAVRLQGIAEPGTVCISDIARRSIDGKLASDFFELGPQDLKNIAEPVTAFSWRTNRPIVVSFSATSMEKPSIAVLPLRNMSGDPEDEYFSDGVTEDLVTALSRIKWFMVIAHSSTFGYKGQTVDVRNIAKELGIGYVVQGSLRKLGKRVRLAAQLIDGSTGKQVWGARYDRDLDDIFELQDELTETLAGAIEPELSRAEQERARLKKPGDLNTWDVYLQGMSAFSDLTKDGLRKAEGLFAQAVELDPDFGAAHAGLAEIQYYDLVLGLSEQRDQSRRECLRFARRAVELDRDDAGAHTSLGRAYTVNHRYDDAVLEFQAAIEINPSHAIAHYGLGATYVFNGRSEVGLPHLQQAIRLSPRDTNLGSFLVRTAHGHLNSRNYDDAIEWAHRALRLPNFQWSRQTVLAGALGHLGRLDEARPHIDEVFARIPEFSSRYMLDNSPMSPNADFQHWLAGLHKAGLPEDF